MIIFPIFSDLLWQFSAYVNFRTHSNSNCLLENKFPPKSFHSCRSTAASFLLRGIRCSGCYRSSQNNVLSGDSSVRRRGKKLPFGDDGDEGEYTGSAEVFLEWSKTLAQDALSWCKTSAWHQRFLFNPILSLRINNFYLTNSWENVILAKSTTGRCTDAPSTEKIIVFNCN